MEKYFHLILGFVEYISATFCLPLDLIHYSVQPKGKRLMLKLVYTSSPPQTCSALPDGLER